MISPVLLEKLQQADLGNVLKKIKLLASRIALYLARGPRFDSESKHL